MQFIPATNHLCKSRSDQFILMELRMVLFLVAVCFMAASVIADVQYTIINNALNKTGGQRFDEVIGSSGAEAILQSATEFIREAFYNGTPSVPEKDVDTVTLYIDDEASVAFTVENTIHLSESYVGSYTQGDVATEVKGVLYHEMTHVWQWDGQGQADSGLIEGIADYIRLTADLPAAGWGSPGEGTSWNQGYDTTAYFLQYCESLQPGFVRSLNAKLATAYDVSFFYDLLGLTVEELWQDYKNKYSS